MIKFKKALGLLAAAALIVGGVSAATFALTTHAQTNNAYGNTPYGNGGGWGGMGMTGRGYGGQMIFGTVTAINGNLITLKSNSGTVYTIDAANAQITKYANNTPAAIQISGIAVGDTLRVSGSISGVNITANRIMDGVLPNGQYNRGGQYGPGDQNLAATGTISAINGNIITLNGNNGTVYTVDAANAQIMVMKPAGTALQNSGVMNGDTLQVFGTVSSNNITATRIMDGTGGFHYGHGMMSNGQYPYQQR